ncbi:hypothetical protein [Flavobacterium lacus]|uniref:Uncharacterized protein n=1 Tax=Flavobacterium lacus TaxID=1353778 RepID=A0A328WJY5_9FLAO|nr:hypothetical protein [Flavobacterium lacus]RAR46520.1 hypothetical protein B0I10_11715 [Flavobacterium lacus]
MQRFLIIYFLVMVITFISCRQSTSDNQTYEEYHNEIHKELDKVSTEIKKFDQQLVILYQESENQPQKVLTKIDSIIEVTKKEKDEFKLQISDHIISSLFYLKAEIYYGTGNYEMSIANIYKSNYKYKSIHSQDATAIAANYIKLGKRDLAKSFIDSIGKGCYIYDYALGNYYESIENKDSALKVYNEIKNDKRRHQHYFYYQPVLNRIINIEKNNLFFKEIYFPTGHPDFDITINDDNEVRTQILDYFKNFPEVKGYSVYIYQGPLIDETDYYWIRVGKGDNYEDDNFAKYNFAVFSEPFEVKFFEPKTNKMSNLKEWRKKKNGM